MSDETPWPRSGDVLFSEGGGLLNACIGWRRNQWHGYVEGYKRAADRLVQHVRDTLRDQDYLVYPIVFLYRHAIEVSLKHLIWMGNQLVHRKLELPAHHDLKKLWSECRPLLEEVWPGGPTQDLDAVGETIDQFVARDSRSTTFRYPVTKELEPSHTTSERIHLGNLSDVANRAFALLEACRIGIGEYLDRFLEAEYDRPNP